MFIPTRIEIPAFVRVFELRQLTHASRFSVSTRIHTALWFVFRLRSHVHLLITVFKTPIHLLHLCHKAALLFHCTAVLIRSFLCATWWISVFIRYSKRRKRKGKTLKIEKKMEIKQNKVNSSEKKHRRINKTWSLRGRASTSQRIRATSSADDFLREIITSVLECTEVNNSEQENWNKAKIIEKKTQGLCKFEKNEKLFSSEWTAMRQRRLMLFFFYLASKLERGQMWRSAEHTSV